HDDEIDRDRAQVIEVLLVARRRENSREVSGMQRLHATAESFAQAHVVRDGRYGESRVLQDLRGPVRADQLKAEVPQAAGEIDQALLVRYAEERPRGRNHPYYRVPIGKSQLKVGTRGERISRTRGPHTAVSGRGASPASFTNLGTTPSQPTGIRWTPRTPSTFFRALIVRTAMLRPSAFGFRSEEHTSEL